MLGFGEYLLPSHTDTPAPFTSLSSLKLLLISTCGLKHISTVSIHSNHFQIFQSKQPFFFYGNTFQYSNAAISTKFNIFQHNSTMVYVNISTFFNLFQFLTFISTHCIQSILLSNIFQQYFNHFFNIPNNVNVYISILFNIYFNQFRFKHFIF